MRAYYIAQGSLLNALLGPKWEGNPKKKGYMHTYGVVLFFFKMLRLVYSQRDLGSNPN